MKPRVTNLLLGALCSVVFVAQLCAQGTAFTYQGRLNDGPALANGAYDLKFSLFGASSGGTGLAGPLDLPAVAISKGLFTVLLDFSADVFTGADRWLEVAVRPASSGAFTTLSPRQPITATPYALSALNALTVAGVSGHALHAADGDPQNAVFVDGAGKVGVGTTFPASRLHVVSDAGDSAPPRFSSWAESGSTFNAGLDFAPGSRGRGYVGVPDSNAAFAGGEMLVYGGPGTSTTLWAGGARRVTVNSVGDIGIGTDAPAVKLDVRGDIRMGPNGEFRPTISEENLRIVRGVVDAAGTILEGKGFTVDHSLLGTYDVTFNVPFSGTPAITATVQTGGFAKVVNVTSINTSSATIVTHEIRDGGFNEDRQFNFIAIGPR